MPAASWVWSGDRQGPTQRATKYSVLVPSLVGRFSMPSENEVRGLLANLGITVQTKLDNTTDYLIVGGEMYVDQDGNALETPMQPSETAVYKDAEAKGVAITPLKDLRAYFKF